MSEATNSTHTIVLATDDVYARPAAVTLSSAYRHSESRSTVAVVIDCGISAESISLLEKAWPGELSIRPLDPDDVACFTSSVPDACMARLALERYVDPETSKALYLDSDVLVRAPLQSLFDTDLHGFTVAAVPASNRPIMGFDSELPWPETEYAIGGAAPGGVVFNAGVLLIDMNEWQRQDVFAQARRLGAQLPASDQRLLNALLSREWLPLAPRWNSKEPDAAIYHFASDPRPWMPNYYRNNIWCEYLEAAAALGWDIPHPSFLPARIRLRAAARAARDVVVR